MDKFGINGSIHRPLIDVEEASDSVKPMTRKCLHFRSAVLQIVLLIFLLVVLTVCVVMLLHMQTEFAKLKLRVDNLESDKLVDSLVDKHLRFRHQEDDSSNSEMKETSLDSRSYFDQVDDYDYNPEALIIEPMNPRDEDDDSSAKTRHENGNIPNQNVKALSIDDIQFEVPNVKKVDDDSDKKNEKIVDTGAGQAGDSDDDSVKIDRNGDIIIDQTLEADEPERDHITLEKSHSTQDGSSYIRRRRNAPDIANVRTTRENVRKPKPTTSTGTQNNRRHSGAIHLDSSVISNISPEQIDKLVSGELTRIALDHGSYTLLGYQPLTDNCNNCYIYKAWTPSNWTNPGDFTFNPTTGRVLVKKRGIYYIYAQILYRNAAARNLYEVMINDNAFIKCMTSVDYVTPNTSNASSNDKYKTCFTGGVTMLNRNQEVYIKDGYGHITDPVANANFFGIIKIADA